MDNLYSREEIYPKAPPPMDAPPPPPSPQRSYYDTSTPVIIHYSDICPSPATRQGKRTVDLGVMLTGGNSSLTPESNVPTTSSYTWFRGDASIRPNVGESNAAIGEASLREALWRGRILNIITCSLALILQIPQFLGNLLWVRPARTILGLYLAVFCSILLVFETGCYGKIWIKTYLGVFHHPLGRSWILFLMGGLAIGQGGFLDPTVWLGIIFVISSIYTLVTYIWYPEYRRRIAEQEGQENRDPIVETNVHDRFWAQPREATALLSAVLDARVK
jgi:hypothetical protein